MPIQKQLALVGIAPQTVKGTPVAAVYQHGVRSGSAGSVDVDQVPEEVTLATRGTPGAIRKAVISGGEFTARAYPKSIGAWLKAACGAVATSGPVSTIYTHVFSAFTADVDYLTFYGRHAADYLRVQDCKIDELTLQWTGTEPLEMSIKTIGTVLQVGTSFTGTTDDSKEIPLSPVLGTFKVDTGSAVAVAASISAGKITIKNGITPKMISKQVEPDDVFPSIQVVEFELTVIPDSLAEWRKVVTGTSSGTAHEESPVYGSFEHTFVDPTDAANKTLKLAATKAACVVPFPDADPGGGATELQISGFVVIPAAGNAFEATLKNGIATY